MGRSKAVVVYVALLLACSLDYCHSGAIRSKRSAVCVRRTTRCHRRRIITTTTSGGSLAECHAGYYDTSSDSSLERVLDDKLVEMPAVFTSSMKPEKQGSESEPYVLSGLNRLRRSGTLRTICQDGGKVLKLQLQSDMPVVAYLQWSTGFAKRSVNVTHHDLSVGLEIPIRIEQSYTYHRCRLGCVREVYVNPGPVTFSLSSSSITVDGICETVSSELGRSTQQILAERRASAVIGKSLITDHIVPWLKPKLSDLYLRRTMSPRCVWYSDYDPRFVVAR